MPTTAFPIKEIKAKTFESSYLYKELSYTNTFREYNLLFLQLFIKYSSIKKVEYFFFYLCYKLDCTN